MNRVNLDLLLDGFDGWGDVYLDLNKKEHTWMLVSAKLQETDGTEEYRTNVLRHYKRFLRSLGLDTQD